MFNFFLQLPRRVGVMLISLYQKTLSPDHGLFRAKYPYGFCRHYPTCSEYSKQAISKYGLFAGTWMAAKRVASCNPWTEMRIDKI